MANDTKERILEAALEMFSQNGYAGTNIRELSASLGLVKSGVYKHYESKEAIWNALLDQMIAYYADHFGSADHLPPVPDSLEALTRQTMRMVNVTVHDEKIAMTRKVLTLEQFRDPRARELATKHFLTGLTDMFTRIFTGMTEKGLRRMSNYECVIYGAKALMIGLPIAAAVTYLIYKVVESAVVMSFTLPWGAIAIAVISVFAVVFASMLYSTNKLKKGSPIDALKDESA